MGFRRLLLSLCLVASAQTLLAQELLPPQLGRVANGVYRNEFFGLSLPLPDEWTHGTASTRHQLTPPGNPGNTAPYILLAASHKPGKLSKQEFAFLMLAQQRPGVQTSKERLVLLQDALRSGKGAQPLGESTTFTLGDHTFERADFQLQGKGKGYQSLVCTSVRGYFLQWNITAASKAALDEAVASLQRLSWFPPEAVPARVRISEADGARLLQKKVHPAYPYEARMGKIQGDVILGIIVNEAGDVVDVELVKGHPLLASAAQAAVSQWKYKPYLYQGKPAEIETEVKTIFSLSEN